jgi:SET domain-containing protein
MVIHPAVCGADLLHFQALGYGSLYNHSYHPNARYDDRGEQTMVFTAIQDIAPGDEITVNYNAEPLDQSPLGFNIITTATVPKSSALPQR